MAESRYEKYIVRKPDLPAHAGPYEGIRSQGWVNSGSLVLCDNNLFKEAGSIIEYGMIKGERPPKTDTFTGPGTHKHDYDELFAFIGTNPDDVYDLGAECEMWLGKGEEREKVTITTTSSIYIPAGLAHLPQYWRNIKRPVIYLVIILNSTEYVFNPASP